MLLRAFIFSLAMAVSVPALPDVKVYAKDTSSWIDLFESFREIRPFTQTVTVTEPTHLFIAGHVDTRHRGIAGTFSKAIMVAFQIQVNGRWLKGSKTGGNILNRTAHYYIGQIHGYKLLNPGTYKIQLFGRSASTAARGVNGLAEVKGTYNQVTYTLVPVN